MENNFISSYLLRLNHNYKGLLVTISAIVTIAIGAITFYQFFSKTPQEILVGMGYQWSAEDFQRSVKLGDVKAVKYFLQSGMDPYTDSQFGPLPVNLCFVTNNPEEVLSTIIKHSRNFNINKVYRSLFPDATLMNRALEVENLKLVKALVENGVNPNKKLKVSNQGFDPTANIRLSFEDTPLNYIRGRINKYGETKERRQLALYLKKVAPNSDREPPANGSTFQDFLNESKKRSQNRVDQLMKDWEKGIRR